MACQMNGQTCTINADCCDTLMCHIPPGSTVGSCDPISSPPPSPGDGGVSDSTPVDAPADAPADSPTTCALYGQSCTASSDCCNGVPCSLGTGPCAAGNTVCTCHYVVQ
jgi:hypothetical protein